VNTPTMQMAKAATTTIPIVFVSADDPVRLGLVTSFNRPGGNATGVYFLIAAMEAKRAELLHEVVPKAPTIALLVDPNSRALSVHAARPRRRGDRMRRRAQRGRRVK
jgi:putative tryptophan/tyrosine transport system substrate-binding protein